MGQTVVQKIVAHACGQKTVAPGDIVTCAVDLVMGHDSSGPRRWGPRLRELGVRPWDPSKIVMITDHFVPAVDRESAAILKMTRDFVKEFGIKYFYDLQGICHIVLAEHGHLKPGMFVAGADSHSPHGGVFGCYIAGYGISDMTAIVATGETWVMVPETFRVNWSGALSDFVSAKDVMLFLCREIGMENSFKVIEYGGDMVTNMSVQERMVLTNMAAELGCETGIVPADVKTLDHIRAHGGEVDASMLDWHSDEDAVYESVHDFDAGTLPPQVALPHSPETSVPVDSVADVAIDQCYIGACVGAKLEDLHMAAKVLTGRKVSAGTRLLVAPSSVMTTKDAAADGTLAALTQAGAIILPSGCGACAGLGAGLLAEGETCISTTNRNFRGRMGHQDSHVYLGSPYTVAASAVAGRIADPRDVAAETLP